MAKAKTKLKRDKRGRFVKGTKKDGGRRTGSKNAKTIAKEKAYEDHQQAILKELAELRSAHFSVAKGTQIIVARDLIWDDKKKKKIRKGRFVRLTRPDEIVDVINDYEEGEDFYIIFTQDPNPKALEDLVNRVFGKPKEYHEFDFKAKELKAIQDDIKSIMVMEAKFKKFKISR